MLFQKVLTQNLLQLLELKKLLPDIESSIAYATGGKLNDIQLNKLIEKFKNNGR